MSLKKYLNEVNELAARYGFNEATQTPGSHLMVQHTVNRRKVFFGSTPSDHRAIRNLESILKRVAALPPLRPGEPNRRR